MTDGMLPEPKRLVHARLVIVAAIFGATSVALVASRSCSAPAMRVIPPLSSSITLVRPTPNVLVAVQDLARLESASFHMERVIDLTDKQSQLFGLIQAEDAILLVAVADVSAGIDLTELSTRDLTIDPIKRTAEISLPAPQVFHAELDNSKTYVHTRRTGVLAIRQENLETRARQEAERSLVDAALQAGLLNRAADNAKRAVQGVVRALGYDQVQVTVRAPVPAAPRAGEGATTLTPPPAAGPH
jgi:hypothetical protein